MAETERKLAAILAMDVADYSAKMSDNEEVTLGSLRVCREIIEKVVSEHKGRIFNTAGDAFMIEFNTTTGALEAAIEIQEKLTLRNKKLPVEDCELLFLLVACVVWNLGLVHGI